MTIIHYQGDVFTHEGQTSVHEFGIEILAARAALAKPISLTVYVGYHGNKNGAWFKNFDATEDAETASIGDIFPNAKLVQVRDRECPLQQSGTPSRLGRFFSPGAIATPR